MKIIQIREQIKHHVHTPDKHYVRYASDDWVERMYFDIIAEDNEISPEIAKELEELFQVEMELERLIKEEQL